ncbi:hypothetical protein F2P81_008988 [Scophthalmus maximus]|uniref:Uncharacterized protein n=1 Tax=Scophthalmus maximus TaxID=52904 RepID=A0A6A4T5N0_SCOMX|nr:hypothetical protein F2P81_008988 [Scophthalmus maximus]
MNRSAGDGNAPESLSRRDQRDVTLTELKASVDKPLESRVSARLDAIMVIRNAKPFQDNAFNLKEQIG